MTLHTAFRRTLKPLGVAVILGLAAGAAGPAPAGDSPVKVAVFEFELVDHSGGKSEAVAEAEQRRLGMVTEYLREALAKTGEYRLVDVSAVDSLEDERLADAAINHYLNDCNGCEADIAEALGAERSYMGLVTKASALMLKLNVFVRDAATGEMIGGYGVDVRSNDDRSWMKGIEALVEREILKEGKSG